LPTYRSIYTDTCCLKRVDGPPEPAWMWWRTEGSLHQPPSLWRRWDPVNLLQLLCVLYLILMRRDFYLISTGLALKLIISNTCTCAKFGFAVVRNVYLPRREVSNCFIPSTMRCVFPFMLASLTRRASVSSVGCLDSIRVRITLV